MEYSQWRCHVYLKDKIEFLLFGSEIIARAKYKRHTDYSQTVNEECRWLIIIKTTEIRFKEKQNAMHRSLVNRV